jgi:hypothetical protein
VDGIRRVQSWIASTQLFFIEKLVPKTIKEMRGYRWAENVRPDGQVKPEAAWKENDDLPDALRYALMTWPELPTRDVAPMAGTRDLSMFTPEELWAIERMAKINRRERGEEPEEDDFTGLLVDSDSGPMGEVASSTASSSVWYTCSYEAMRAVKSASAVSTGHPR